MHKCSKKQMANMRMQQFVNYVKRFGFIRILKEGPRNKKPERKANGWECRLEK
ncbi:TPA: hypothetical protein QCY38_002430 [Bacillus toyonensis]|uniref:hypothetical protein n=1 Tax=Bacillus toyonensis TaxID=155322 RepID=UPI0015D4A088|nr:hypothetical protein [Bacillus toyonensis]QPW51969.1 hypothetical protein G9298_30590 [Bacillus thuringiensis]HDR7948803.1 hypothetical protein [Bacillus toyonensis]